MKDLIYTILWITGYAVSAAVAFMLLPHYMRWMEAIDRWCTPRRRYWERKYKWETDPPVSLPHKPIDRVALVKYGIVRPIENKHSK